MDTSRTAHGYWRLLPVGLVLLVTACNGTSNSQASNDAPDWQTQAFVQDAGGSAATSFGAGQHIRLLARLTNLSGSVQSLKFPTPVHYELDVFKAGTSDLAWDYQQGGGTAVIQVVTQITLAAGQAQNFDYTWDQLGLDGQAVPPGDYALQARMLTTADTAPFDDLTPSPYRSKLVKFTIRP